MYIRHFELPDLPMVIKLWEDARNAGEVLFYPLTADYFASKFTENPAVNSQVSFVALQEMDVVGFINGAIGSQADTAYLTCVFVRRDVRRQGIGRALLDAFTQEMHHRGVSQIAVSGGNPIKLDWLVPGTPGHDHNNAPGCDTKSPGYGFLRAMNFIEGGREIAMYMDLAQYKPLRDLALLQQRLLDAGIDTGRYHPQLRYEFDGMCDRVGSDYWRGVLREETAKTSPRVILAATVPGHIVGFTGPVDLQPSGRGWFTGICTDPNYQGRGIATVLFHLLMQEFIQIGASFTTLFTGEENPARRIYERAGLSVVRTFATMKKSLQDT